MNEGSNADRDTDDGERWGWEFVAEQAWLAHSQLVCHACLAITPVVGLYVRDSFERELADPEQVRRVDGFLHYVTQLDEDTELLAIRQRSRLWPDNSNTARLRYWMNHCEHCGAAQGDHYVFSTPGDAFFPTDDAGVRALRYERLSHTLRATGRIGEVSFGPPGESDGVARSDRE